MRKRQDVYKRQPGEYPYKEILRTTTCESTPYDLKQLGYSSHAIHNHRGAFYGRNKVFSNMGFDTFTSLEYMNNVMKTPKNWAKDALLTEQIVDALDSTEAVSYTHLDVYKRQDDGNPEFCIRNTFAYEGCPAGEGRFIHTYVGDGNPLPSFEGEPEKVDITGDIDAFADTVWNSLNEDNKVSLFVRFIDIETGKYDTRIINKNK